MFPSSRWITTIVLISITFFHPQKGQAQESSGLSNPVVIQGTLHGTSIPLSNAPAYVPGNNNKPEKLGYWPKLDWHQPTYQNQWGLPEGPDPALQSEYPAINDQRSIVLNFPGADYASLNPSDPSLDVGPNHVIQMTNGSGGSRVLIYDKSGNELEDISLSSITNINGLGDPIVIYDQLADRWLLTEFATSGNLMVCAVSQTPDPQGAYFIYSFAGINFPDYPKYAIWPDAYYVTTNESSPRVYAFDRVNMLAGNPSTAQNFNLTDLPGFGFQTATPISLIGSTPPPNGTPGLIMRFRDTENNGGGCGGIGGGGDCLEFYEFSVDWSTPANSSLTFSQFSTVSEFDINLCGLVSFSCIEQPSGSPDLDPLREVIMNRAFYRVFDGHHTLVCTHVTDVSGSDDAGVRWYELRQDTLMGSNWNLFQEGTYAPDADSRWMSSIAINGNGSIALAYNISSSTTFPGIRYTGRNPDDPLGIMSWPETTIIDGSGSNGSNRYGDYNTMVVDPFDDYTFWFTGNYNPGSQWETQITSFVIPDTSGPAVVRFEDTGLTITEADSSQNGCIRSATYYFDVEVSKMPEAPVDITLHTEGIAAEGINRDFYLMPKQFTLDSMQTSRTCTLEVYDDWSIEGNEISQITYSLDANGGSTDSGFFNQTFLLNILDNDFFVSAFSGSFAEDFDIPPGNWAVTDGGNTTDTWSFVPDRGGNTLDGTPFLICDSDANGNGNTMDEQIETPSINLSTATMATLEFDHYYRNYGPVTNDTARVEVWNGSQWVKIFEHNHGDGTIGAWNAPAQVSIDLTPYMNGNTKIRFHYEAGWDWWWAIDNVVITADVSPPIATQVDPADPFEIWFGPEHLIELKNDEHKVMARLENLTTHDHGCIEVQIDRSGEGGTNLAGETDTTLRYFDKTWLIQPQDNQAPDSTSYRFTAFFTNDEKNGWESATTKSILDTGLVITRYDSAVSDVSIQSEFENGRWLTVDSFGNGYTVSQTFQQGFGGFGVNSRPICPDSIYIGGLPIDGTYYGKIIRSDARILMDREVHYRARNNIDLLDSFTVDSGAIFTADILYNCLADNPTQPDSLLQPLALPINNQMVSSRYHEPMPEATITYSDDGSPMISGIVNRDYDVVVRAYDGRELVYVRTLPCTPNINALYEVNIPEEIPRGVSLEVEGYYGIQAVKYFK